VENDNQVVFSLTIDGKSKSIALETVLTNLLNYVRRKLKLRSMSRINSSRMNSRARSVCDRCTRSTSCTLCFIQHDAKEKSRINSVDDAFLCGEKQIDVLVFICDYLDFV
jgi:short-subunit dehydrogenase